MSSNKSTDIKFRFDMSDPWLEDNRDAALCVAAAPQCNQRHAPASDEEEAFGFKNACDISDVEQKIARLEFLPEKTALDIEAKNRLLADARQRLDDLKSAKFQPSTLDEVPAERVERLSRSEAGTGKCDQPNTQRTMSFRPLPVHEPESPLLVSDEPAPSPNVFALPGVKTTEIIEGFRLVEKKWPDTLSRKSDKRYKDAIHTPGGPGKGMHTWKPAHFAICLLKSRERTLPGALRSTIIGKWPEWLPEFESQLEKHLNESGKK